MLEIDDNEITSLPIGLVRLTNLIYFSFAQNPIENVHPSVQRFIRGIDSGINSNIKTLKAIIKDQTQNKAVISSGNDDIICLPPDIDSENGTDHTGGKNIEDEVKKVFNSKKTKKLERGIAFPTCISVNHIVGHYSPLVDEST
jgi:hypothetical protein